MKYLLLYYYDEDADEALPVSEQRQLMDEHDEFAEQLENDGVMEFGATLDRSSTASVVRDDGVTEGPLAEGAQQLGGVCVIECADIGEAVAYAKRVPQNPSMAVEVRPILDM